MSTQTLVLLFLVAGGGSFLLSSVLVPLAMRIAPRIGYVDHPGGHKSHMKVTPYGGGCALFIAGWLPTLVVLSLCALVPAEWFTHWFGTGIEPYIHGLHGRVAPTLVILGGGVVLHAMGLRDDFKPLGPYLKLGVMTAVSLVVTIFGGVRMGEMAGPVVSVILTTAWIVVITNAMNFLDNMDGLSAGIAAIAAAFLVVCGLMAGQVFVPGLACIFLGAILGFLIYNFPPAKIFMGDAGSLLIGYMLAVVSILTSYWKSGTDHPPYALAMPLVVLAVPLYDFTSVVVIRLLEGRNPLKGDQRHFSHRLVDRGLSRRSAVLTIYLATAATGLSATLLPGAGLREAITILSFVLMVLLIIAILEAPLRKAS